MVQFPMFVDLRGKRVLLVGSPEQTRRRARALESFGPRLEYLLVLTRQALEPRPTLVILTDGNRREAAALCRERHIPVNSVDDPENSDFHFPGLVCRGDLVIGISTGGTAPAAAAALRRRVEAALPDNTEKIFSWLGQLTARLRQRVPDYGCRARLLTAIADEALEKNRPLTGDELKKYDV